MKSFNIDIIGHPGDAVADIYIYIYIYILEFTNVMRKSVSYKNQTVYVLKLDELKKFN